MEGRTEKLLLEMNGTKTETKSPKEQGDMFAAVGSIALYAQEGYNVF